MLDLSDIKSSQEELQDYYAQLRGQHATPAWIRQWHQHRASKQGRALPVALARSTTTGDAGGPARRYPAGRTPGSAPDHRWEHRRPDVQILPRLREGISSRRPRFGAPLFAHGRLVENIAHARQPLNLPATQNEPSGADSSRMLVAGPLRLARPG